MIIIAVCWLFHVRLRSAVSALGMTVILATFALGIHWLADIVAGVGVGMISVMLARRWTDMTERRELALESAHRIVAKKARPIRPLAETGGSWA